MAEDNKPTKKPSIGGAPTVEPQLSHGGRRFAAGDVILGRYVVESELGQGGMGVVYKCFDKVGGVKVAVKGLPPDVAHNEGEMEEIRANFQLVCDLRHENIAGVRTLEKDVSGDYYLVMDLAHGDDLGSWMRKNKDADLKVRLSIIRQVASALDYAHRRRVMHRDIKPGNIMVSPSGRVLLLDFGLAAQISTSLSRSSRMVVSQSGTPAYKSPEQWRGKPQGAAADQYALAVVAYRLLSGRLPFDGDNVLILCRAVLEERPPAIKYLPSHINRSLAKALAKEPNDRFPNCTAFVDALEGKNAAGGFWKLLFVIFLAVGALLAAGGAWLHFERKRLLEEQAAAEEAARKKADEEEARRKAEEAVAEARRKAEAAAEARRKAEAAAEARRKAEAAAEARRKAEAAAEAKRKAEEAARAQLAIDKKKSDRARLVAENAQKEAIGSGINIQNDDYQAACLRMGEAEDLYKKGNYKQATVKFYLAEDQFSKSYRQVNSNCATTTNSTVITINQVLHALPPSQQPTIQQPTIQQPTIQQPTIQQPTIQQPTMQPPTMQQPTMQQPTMQQSTMQPPTMQPPTIEQKKADQARLDAETAQKKAMGSGVKDQGGDYRAACSRIKEAEDYYKKGKYKQASFKFYQAVDQFSRIHEEKE